MLQNKSKEYLRQEYRARINKVQDYIDGNVSEELTVARLSEVANFSPYHFQRIFSAMTGETLYKYILRIRLEKAAYLLIAHPKKTVTEIALECGFTSSSVFARAFRQFFGVTAKEWANNPQSAKSIICKTNSRNCKDYVLETSYNENAAENGNAKIIIRREKFMSEKSFTVEVKTIEAIPVVYVRHTGPYKGDSGLFQRLNDKLLKWAGPRGLINFPKTKTITVYHDNPELTDDDKLRISVCISAPADTKVDGDIGKMIIPGGKYAVGYFEIKENQYSEAWAFMYGKWLPESGYQPDDGFTFENYLNDPSQHPDNIHIVEIYIPVKPL